MILGFTTSLLKLKKKKNKKTSPLNHWMGWKMTFPSTNIVSIPRRLVLCYSYKPAIPEATNCRSVQPSPACRTPWWWESDGLGFGGSPKKMSSQGITRVIPNLNLKSVWQPYKTEKDWNVILVVIVTGGSWQGIICKTNWGFVILVVTTIGGTTQPQHKS